MIRRLSPILLLVWLFPSLGLAQQSDEEKQKALSLYEEGEKLYQAGEYEASAAKYKQGYELSGKAGFLYNIAQAYRLANDCVKALDYYLLYLEKGSAAQSARKTRVAELIGQIRPCAEKQRAEAANTANASEADLGSSSPAVPPIAPKAPSDEQGSSLRWVSYVTGGVGLALIGTGVFFGLDAADKSDQVTQISVNGGEWNEAAEALESDGKRANTIATSLYIAGGVALAASVTLYVLGSGDDEVPETSVTLAPTRGGAAMVWRGEF